MRLLLDTHTLFWSVETPSKLSAAAMAAIQDPANDRILSAATIWELAIKVGQKENHAVDSFPAVDGYGHHRSEAKHLADHGRICGTAVPASGAP